MSSVKPSPAFIGIILCCLSFWSQGLDGGCPTVTLISPLEGAVSRRVLQDFTWSTHPPGTLFDFRVERFDEGIQDFVPFIEYASLAQSDRLTNNGQLPNNRFHPPWFLDKLALVEVTPGVFKEVAPVLYPNSTYRWSVRVTGSGNDCWTSRHFYLEMDPSYRVGINTHLSTPLAWWPELGSSAPTEGEILALGSDIQNLSAPFVFEGMLQAWGRDAFRSSDLVRPAFWESDRFMDAISTTTSIISQCMFHPFRVRDDGGNPIIPQQGTDFYTMFEPQGMDALYLDPLTYSVLPQYRFSRHDPRTRPVDLIQVTLDDAALNWHDLWAYWDGIYCAYHEWRIDPSNTLKRQAILDRMTAYEADADQFDYQDMVGNQNAFGAYLSASTLRYAGRGVIRHFGNEPNGNWHIDPRLYARQLAFFAEHVRNADSTARIMMATIFPGNPAAIDGELFQEGYPDFWWITQFTSELRSMRSMGEIQTLPFDLAGINYYLIRDSSSRAGDARLIEPGRGASCAGNHTACPGLVEQECQFNLFARFYWFFKSELDQLATEFEYPGAIPIIIKETASVAGQIATIEEHLSRGIAFVHELGFLEDPYLAPARRTQPRDPARLDNTGLDSRIEAVLWFHYHLANQTSLLDRDAFPSSIVHTSLWDAVSELNQPCAPRTIDAGLDLTTLCGQGQIIGSPGSEFDRFNWQPTAGLDDPSIAQPIANPTMITHYTLTVTNPCGEVQQDQVRVFPVPVYATQSLGHWRGPPPSLAFDINENGWLDVADYAMHINSTAACP